MTALGERSSSSTVAVIGVDVPPGKPEAAVISVDVRPVKLDVAIISVDVPAG
jgi:hypothetical protein